MGAADHFAVIAFPLNRADVVDFLLPPSPVPRGTKLHIIGQRPVEQSKATWLERLRRMPVPSLADFLDIDDPGHNLLAMHTDRLVPIEFLAKPDYLTRGLGGWTPIYFGVARLPADPAPDPLLANLVVLADYGRQVRYFGADTRQVAQRLQSEIECEWPAFVSALLYLSSLRPRPKTEEEAISASTKHIERLFNEILSGNRLATAKNRPVPEILLYDELLDQMRSLELSRRRYLMDGKAWYALRIQTWQEMWQQESGLIMIVKGEYIAGRHRGSLVLIAPDLGVVIKQPAPEPFHEIKLNAKNVNGQSENWPVLTHNGALVTSRGRVRLLLEEGFIPRLHQVFQHEMTCSTLMGYTIEDYVVGQMVQEYVLADHERMTADLYDIFVLHQQTCELMGVENGDWHAANFILRDKDGEIVHIDWGAARPLRAEERSPAGCNARLNQVRNIAFSFHNHALAKRTERLHAELLADEERLQRIKRRAQQIVNDPGQA